MPLVPAIPFAIVCCSGCLLGVTTAAWAQAEEQSPQPAAGPASTRATLPLPEVEGGPTVVSPVTPALNPPRPAFEGALGPVLNWSQQGRTVQTQPGFYLRYKRVSVSNTSNFAVRRNDDVFNGLGLDVLNDEHWRFNLGLRYDRGGRISDLPSLAGIDRVEATVRMRAGATYQITPQWSAGVGWSTDLLGRGGGQIVDIGVSREKPLGPRLKWLVGTGVSAADSRYQRSYFGVTPTQSARSGLPVYTPGGGVLNASIGTSVRMDISPSWVGFTGLSAVRRMGPQLDSPLTTWSTNWGWSVGIARRF